MEGLLHESRPIRFDAATLPRSQNLKLHIGTIGATSAAHYCPVVSRSAPWGLTELFALSGVK